MRLRSPLMRIRIVIEADAHDAITTAWSGSASNVSHAYVSGQVHDLGLEARLGMQACRAGLATAWGACRWRVAGARCLPVDDCAWSHGRVSSRRDAPPSLPFGLRRLAASRR